MNINESESIFVDKIELFLKNNKFKTWREIIPNECKTWNLPVRIDLIFYREDIGYIGVECKRINTFGQGSKIASAIEQIKKYRNLHYFDNNIIIQKWCISVNHGIDDKTFYDVKRVLIFIQAFCRYHKISFLELFRNKIIIDSNTKQKILIENG